MERFTRVVERHPGVLAEAECAMQKSGASGCLQVSSEFFQKKAQENDTQKPVGFFFSTTDLKSGVDSLLCVNRDCVIGSGESSQVLIQSACVHLSVYPDRCSVSCFRTVERAFSERTFFEIDPWPKTAREIERERAFSERDMDFLRRDSNKTEIYPKRDSK